ncbi:hypothetical protein [Actinoplanes sp. URMC 104]|uniref:hypothetical protein n=1 Tax=Actinoplanes sp. URMC 104 TaxID=3423409 RepID=UPI003F1BF5D5
MESSEARVAGPVGGAGGGDLGEALAIAEGEVRRRGTDPGARHALVEVLLGLGWGERALREAERLVEDERPGARTLLAEALLLQGRVAEAARVARLAYALESGDRGRALLVVARTEVGEQAVATARAALEQRVGFYPAESHYVLEARRVVEELSRC